MALAKDRITLTNVNDGYVGNDGKTYVLNIINGQRSITYNEVGTSPSPATSTAFSYEFLIDGVLTAVESPNTVQWNATGHLSGASTLSTFTPTYAQNFNSTLSNTVSLTIVYNGATLRASVPIAVTKIGDIRYTWIKYADNASGDGINDSPVGKTYIGIAHNKTSPNESNVPGDYVWSLFEGPSGRGISSALVQYTSSTSGTAIPQTGWNTEIPTVALGNYLWTKITTLYTSGDPSYSYSVSRVGKDGDDGNSIVSTVIEYAKSSVSDTAPITGWQPTVPALNPGEFLWTRTTISYTNTSDSVAYSVGSAGETGTGIDSIIEEYYLSDSKTELVGDTWSSNYPIWQEGKYLWTRNLITYKNPTSVTTTGEKVNIEWELSLDVREEIYLKNIETFLNEAEISHSNTESKISIVTDISDTTFQDSFIIESDLYEASYSALRTEIENVLTAGVITKAQFENIQSLYSDFQTRLGLVLGLIEEAYRIAQDEKRDEILGSLRIGSTNLILNSNFKRGFEHWTIEEGEFTKTLISGRPYLTGEYATGVVPTISQKIGKSAENYAISIEASATEGSILRLVVEERNGAIVAETTQDFIPKGSFSYYYFKSLNLDDSKNYYLKIQVVAGFVTFTNIKVELGTVYTDWSPAPEDSQSFIDDILDDDILTRSERSSLYNEFKQIQSEYEELTTIFETNTDFEIAITALTTAYNNLYTALDPILGLEVDGNGIPTNPNFSNEEIISFSNTGVNSALNTYYEKLNSLKTAILKQNYDKATESWDSLSGKIDASREAVMEYLISNQDDPEANFIYEQDGQLYINASFIKAGGIDAKYIKTGILSSDTPDGSKGITWIDLNDGSFSFGGGQLTYNSEEGLKINFDDTLNKLLEEKADADALNTTNKDVADQGALLEELRKSLDKSISFSNGKITIGTDETGLFRFEISNTAAIFYYGTTELAKFTNDSLTAPRVTIEENLTIGTLSGASFKIERKTSNGNLTFRRA